MRNKELVYVTVPVDMRYFNCDGRVRWSRSTQLIKDPLKVKPDYIRINIHLN